MLKNLIYLVWYSAAAFEARPIYQSTITADFPHFIFSPVVHDLGVTLDQELTFSPHIHRLCHDSYYQLRQLRTVVRSLTSDATGKAYPSWAFITLDYCSSRYAGLPVGQQQCLDWVLSSRPGSRPQ